MTKAASLFAFCILLVGTAAMPAAAGPSQRATAAPLKDCTRVNGRYGYYGSPWCTPAEQKRWDVWDSRRQRRLSGGS